MNALRRIRRAFARQRRPEVGHRDAPARACIWCGDEIVPGLAAMGAVACHDCRPAQRINLR